MNITNKNYTYQLSEWEQSYPQSSWYRNVLNPRYTPPRELRLIVGKQYFELRLYRKNWELYIVGLEIKDIYSVYQRFYPNIIDNDLAISPDINIAKQHVDNFLIKYNKLVAFI